MPADYEARLLVAQLSERIRGLHSLFDRLLEEREKQVNIHSAAVQRATDAAMEAQRAVNVAANEWRGSLKDQQQTLATRGEVDRLTERISKMENAIERTAGRAIGVSAVLAIVIPAAIALGVAFWKGGL